MYLSFPQTHEPFILAWKFEFCDDLKFDSLEACKGKKAAIG